MITHLTEIPALAYLHMPKHHGKGYSIAQVWQLQTCTHNHIITGLPIPVSCLSDHMITACTHVITTNICGPQEPCLYPVPQYSLMIILTCSILSIHFCYIPESLKA